MLKMMHEHLSRWLLLGLEQEGAADVGVMDYVLENKDTTSNLNGPKSSKRR